MQWTYYLTKNLNIMITSGQLNLNANPGIIDILKLLLCNEHVVLLIWLKYKDYITTITCKSEYLYNKYDSNSITANMMADGRRGGRRSSVFAALRQRGWRRRSCWKQRRIPRHCSLIRPTMTSCSLQSKTESRSQGVENRSIFWSLSLTIHLTSLSFTFNFICWPYWLPP